jgi:hypothetical protein
MMRVSSEQKAELEPAELKYLPNTSDRLSFLKYLHTIYSLFDAALLSLRLFGHGDGSADSKIPQTRFRKLTR